MVHMTYLRPLDAALLGLVAHGRAQAGRANANSERRTAS